MRHITPVIRILLQDNLYTGGPAHELKGTGPDGIAGIIGAVLLDRRRAGHGRRVHGEVVEEGSKDLFECDLDRVVIHNFDGIDRTPGEFGIGELTRVVVRMVGVDLALQVELDRLGIEVGAVVELHALAQVKGVLQAVI